MLKTFDCTDIWTGVQTTGTANLNPDADPVGNGLLDHYGMECGDGWHIDFTLRRFDRDPVDCLGVWSGDGKGNGRWISSREYDNAIEAAQEGDGVSGYPDIYLFNFITW